MTLVKKPVAADNNYKYIKYKEALPGSVLACGVYEGFDMKKNFDPSKPDVPSFKIKQEDGTTVVLNSATNLNKLLQPLTIGTLLEVVFKGPRKAKSKAGLPFTVLDFDVSEFIDE